MIEEINENKTGLSLIKLMTVTCIVKKNKGRTYKLPISETKEDITTDSIVIKKHKRIKTNTL